MLDVKFLRFKTNTYSVIVYIYLIFQRSIDSYFWADFWTKIHTQMIIILSWYKKYTFWHILNYQMIFIGIERSRNLISVCNPIIKSTIRKISMIFSWGGGISFKGFQKKCAPIYGSYLNAELISLTQYSHW